MFAFVVVMVKLRKSIDEVRTLRFLLVPKGRKGGLGGGTILAKSDPAWRAPFWCNPRRFGQQRYEKPVFYRSVLVFFGDIAAFF